MLRVLATDFFCKQLSINIHDGYNKNHNLTLKKSRTFGKLKRCCLRTFVNSDLLKLFKAKSLLFSG